MYIVQYSVHAVFNVLVSTVRIVVVGSIYKWQECGCSSEYTSNQLVTWAPRYILFYSKVYSTVYITVYSVLYSLVFSTLLVCWVYTLRHMIHRTTFWLDKHQIEQHWAEHSKLIIKFKPHKTQRTLVGSLGGPNKNQMTYTQSFRSTRGCVLRPVCKIGYIYMSQKDKDGYYVGKCHFFQLWSLNTPKIDPIKSKKKSSALFYL